MPKNQGVKRVMLAGVYAMDGLRAAFVHEAAFRQETLLALVFVPLACVLDVGPTERVLLVGVTLLVLIVELLNSAVEAAIDRIGPELHELSGRAKDMGSGAVLVALVLWLWVWTELALLPWLAARG